MKMKYDSAEDIMMVELSSDPIDFAEEMGPVIVHFTENNKPVLLEILDASEFISLAVKSAIIRRKDERRVAVAA